MKVLASQFNIRSVFGKLLELWQHFISFLSYSADLTSQASVRKRVFLIYRWQLKCRRRSILGEALSALSRFYSLTPLQQRYDLKVQRVHVQGTHCDLQCSPTAFYCLLARDIQDIPLK